MRKLRKSPFPGMDPYLEARWNNVHLLMVSAIAAFLKPALPPGLEARPEEVKIESIAGERMRGFRSEIAVIDSGKLEISKDGSGAGTAVMEPIRLQFHRGPVVLRRVEVVDTLDNDRVVTIIEVLSPWNKLPGKLNRNYVAKLKAMEEGGANWVEIDLLRSSRSHLIVTRNDISKAKRTPYLAVTFNSHTDELLAYPISIRQPLPEIGIPLREGEAIVSLNLQSVLSRVLSDGPFDALNYSTPLDPPLSAGDADWAAELLANRVT